MNKIYKNQKIIYQNIDFSIPEKLFIENLKIKESSDIAGFQNIIKGIKKYANIKGVLKQALIQEHTEDTVKVEQTVFKSRVLAKATKHAGKVFAFVMTCGDEINSAVPEEDLLLKYYLDTIGEYLLDSAFETIQNDLQDEFQIKKTASIVPGSAESDMWPLTEQKKIFHLMGNVKDDIGVILTESCLMRPAKSRSGLFFPSEIDFQTCRICKKPKCSSRKAGFNKKIFNHYYGENT